MTVMSCGRSVFNVILVFLNNRLSALKALIQSLLHAEDVIKVHEARLTEKDTTSLDLREVENYRSTLKVCHTSHMQFMQYSLAMSSAGLNTYVKPCSTITSWFKIK